MMPNMSGLEVCKTVRKQYDNYELPIIMVTARYQVKDVVECLSAGANDYLVKPYHEKELLARVFNQISTRQYWLTDQENSQLKQEILKRKSLEKQLANANKRLLQALDLSDEGIAIFDESLTVIYRNDALEKNWADTNENNLIGKPIKTLIPEDQREYFDVAMKNGRMPLTLSIKLSDTDSFYQLHIDRFTVDKTPYYRLLAPKKTGNSSPPAPTNEVIKELATELTESRHKFDQLEAALKQVTRLVKNNQSNESHPTTEAKIATTPGSTDKRETLVKLLRTALIFWERYSGKSKVDLAEESQCWRVYLDGTTAKTRTLDRYLSTKTLPDKPRWRLAIRTANFVIDKCALSGEDFEEITKLMDDLDRAYS